jgi:hypothetical protein
VASAPRCGLTQPALRSARVLEPDDDQRVARVLDEQLGTSWMIRATRVHRSGAPIVALRHALLMK